MRRVGIVVGAFAICCGCAQWPQSADAVSALAGVALAPHADITGRLLPAADESDWHKEADVGPMVFGEDGLPVTTQSHPSQAPPSRFKRMGLRLGALMEIHTINGDDTSNNLTDDGPVVGAYLRLGGAKGRFALDLGYEHLWIMTESWDTGQESKSNVESAAIDFLVFLNGPKSRVRLYSKFGGRYFSESVEVWIGNATLDFQNSGPGWSGGLGILTGQYDFRFEHIETAGDNSVGMDSFTLAWRF